MKVFAVFNRYYFSKLFLKITTNDTIFFISCYHLTGSSRGHFFGYDLRFCDGVFDRESDRRKKIGGDDAFQSALYMDLLRHFELIDRADTKFLSRLHNCQDLSRSRKFLFFSNRGSRPRAKNCQIQEAHLFHKIHMRGFYHILCFGGCKRWPLCHWSITGLWQDHSYSFFHS